MASDGLARVRIDGEVRDLTEEIKLDRHFQHSTEVMVDRPARTKRIELRLNLSRETSRAVGPHWSM